MHLHMGTVVEAAAAWLGKRTVRDGAGNELEAYRDSFRVVYRIWADGRGAGHPIREGGSVDASPAELESLFAELDPEALDLTYTLCQLSESADCLDPFAREPMWQRLLMGV